MRMKCLAQVTIAAFRGFRTGDLAVDKSPWSYPPNHVSSSNVHLATTRREDIKSLFYFIVNCGGNAINLWKVEIELNCFET